LALLFGVPSSALGALLPRPSGIPLGCLLMLKVKEYGGKREGRRIGMMNEAAGQRWAQ